MHVSYKYLQEEFGEDKLKERLEYFHYTFSFFIHSKSEALGFEYEKHTQLSDPIISDVVLSYFSDIHRLKKFHNIEKVNNFKIAAYTGFWISKLKPIQLINCKENDSFLRKINEYFALATMMELIKDKYTSNLAEQSELKEFNQLWEILVYNLHYRSLDKYALELMLLSLVAR